MSGPAGNGVNRGGRQVPAYRQTSAQSAPSFSPSFYGSVSSRTVDVQTTASSLRDASQEQDVSAPASPQCLLTGSRNVQELTSQQRKIAEYIASEMKEQYMEQTRTLEEIQLKMKQELLARQAQLMQQLQCIESAQPPSLSNGSSFSPPPPTVPNDGPASLNPPDAFNTPVTESSGPSAFSNGMSNKRESAADNTPSVSTDESMSGNISQSSSHDTWDSANALAHERPVLTGSERSTPTPVLLSADSSNDLELLSQSVHLPVIDSSTRNSIVGQQADLKTSNGGNSPVNGFLSSNGVVTASAVQSIVSIQNAAPSVSVIPDAADVVTVTAIGRAAFNGEVEEPTELTPRGAPPNDSTPRNHQASPTIQEVAVVKPELDVGSRLDTSPIENGDHLSDSSTPPPESPADDLSASLRFSLRQKHSRHLADMKAYYEQELSDLKEKLTSSLAISQHSIYQALETDNNKLRERCRVLEEELLRANRYINNVDKQMQDLESSFNATLASSSKETKGHDEVPQVSADEQVYKNKLVQAEEYIALLESKNKDLFSAVCDAYEVRDTTARTASQSSRHYDELKSRYDELKTSNEITVAKLEATESHLASSRKDLESLKESVKRLEVDQQKLAKDNEMLRLLTSTSHNDSWSAKSNIQEHRSPMLQAERRLQQASTNTSPNKQRSRHHNSDKSHQHTRQQSNGQQSTKPHSNDLNKQSSPQPLSDATQSSDNSAREYSTRHRSKHSNKKTSKCASSDHNETSVHHTVGKDDLITAYSPIVDRQRHSSSASSGGLTYKTSSSPTRQSIDRPFGYHHVGASMSPSKRTQQWAVLSPFSRHVEPTKTNRENGSQTTNQSPAMKNLNFSFRAPPTSPQKSKINDKEGILDKVRTGKVFSEDPDKSTKKSTNVYQDRLQLIRDAETRLDELLVEKLQLESSLTRMSTTHNMKDKLRQESLEEQLDKVDKDLGSVRMTLRRYNAL
ncbi:M-phase phosphoprotein 9-like [Watersipora subatra]|uniref:M-phase phosphoprotein 9-like n=1 Tax=Watersipora subatra TaxID=2589382 RepID=UPI00355B2112